ncbi:MAG: Ig-like domain-containing protein, partial [Thermoplasmatota archaeon]
ICPKNTADIPRDTFVSIDPAGSNNRDDSPSGGWVVGYDSREVHDGFFLFRANMVDEEGTTGTDAVSVYINNNPPDPEIVNPLDGDSINGTVIIEAIEGLNSEDISTTTFEFQNTGDWHVIAIDEDDANGWKAEWNTTNIPDGTYRLKVTMADYAGSKGVDTITVQVDNVADNTPPLVEITLPEDNVEVSIPRINVTGHAYDPDFDIVRIYFQWQWQGGSTNDNRSYDPPRQYISFRLEILTLQEGWNRVTVGAEDAAGNYGNDSVNIYYVPDGEDTTPPTTTKEIGQPNWEDGYVIAPYTPIWLHATDDQSGVAYIHYEIAWDNNEDGIWDETFQEEIPADIVEIHTQDWGILHGIIELRWYAVDNADNKEQMHHQQHYVITE